MDEATWTKVDDYLAGELLGDDPVLAEVVRVSREAGLPDIAVSPTQGKLLELLVKMHKARSILEIGTLGGYSTICLARALPALGRLVTLEREPRHADVARGNVERAGLADLVDIRVGPAQDTLPTLDAEGLGPFDFVFIDADKPGNPTYLEWSLRLTAPGSVILLDNAVRQGAVADPETQDPAVVGVRRFMAMVATDERLEATAIQTVGVKGYDGFALLLVR